MSGRSKCTAGGDEDSTKRSGEMESHASHKHIVDIQSHKQSLAFTLAHTFIIVYLLAVYTSLFLHISYPEIKCCSINFFFKNVSAEWLIELNLNCYAKVLISHSVREKSIERFHHCSSSLLSPAPIASQQIRPPR